MRRHISALEDELDVRLFDPRPDRYALTDEGEILLKIAEDMEGAAASAQNRIASREIGIFGTVRIGVPDGLGTLFVAPRLARLRQQHPGLQIELVVTSRHFNLSRREADMALVVGRPAGKRIRVKKMTDVTMRLYGSESYLAGKPAITSIDDLADHDFVSGVDEFDFGHALNRVAQDDVPAFVARIACTSVVAQLKAVATGSGLCYFANFIADTEPGSGPCPAGAGLIRPRGVARDAFGFERTGAYPGPLEIFSSRSSRANRGCSTDPRLPLTVGRQRRSTSAFHGKNFQPIDSKLFIGYWSRGVEQDDRSGAEPNTVCSLAYLADVVDGENFFDFVIGNLSDLAAADALERFFDVGFEFPLLALGAHLVFVREFPEEFPGRRVPAIRRYARAGCSPSA